MAASVFGLRLSIDAVQVVGAVAPFGLILNNQFFSRTHGASVFRLRLNALLYKWNKRWKFGMIKFFIRNQSHIKLTI